MRKVLYISLAALWLLSIKPVTAAETMGNNAVLNASGNVKVETGGFFSDSFQQGTGSINLTAADSTGDRVTPLPPHDQLSIKAMVNSGGHKYEVMAQQPMIEDSLGRHTTWQGVSFDRQHHGRSGIGSAKLPNIKSSLLAFGLGDVTMDGNLIARNVPVHVMTADSGIPGKLELEVGDEAMGAIPNLPNGHLRVLWDSYQATLTTAAKRIRYLGSLILLLLIFGAFTLNRYEPKHEPASV